MPKNSTSCSTKESLCLHAIALPICLPLKERFTQDMQPHYIYSPREMTRWVRGICEALRPLETLPIEGLVRIWAHEALRLFHDRLDNIDLVANINTFVFVSCP